MNKGRSLELENIVNPSYIVQAWIDRDTDGYLGSGSVENPLVQRDQICFWRGGKIINLPNRMPEDEEKVSAVISRESFDVEQLCTIIGNHVYSTAFNSPEAHI